MDPFGIGRRREDRESRLAHKIVEEQRSITEIPGYWPEVGGPQAVASASRALSLVPVFGAVKMLADSVASLTPNLYTLDKSGEVLIRQPTPSLFAQPSIHGTLYDWLHRAVTSMALQGDAIGLITAQDYYGWPTMIEWLNPEQVATQDGKLYGPGSYMNPLWWWWGRPIDPRQLLHVPWFTMPYRVRGLSPIGAYQMTTNIGIGAQEYSQNWFGQGGVPPGTFKNAQRVVSPEDADKITARITARLQSRKPLVFGNDWDYTPIAIKPHEAQFIETMGMTATHIAVIYGLPPRRLGGKTGDNMTYTTVEMDTIDYLTFSLRPWLRKFEYSLTRCFPRGQFIKFDTAEMLLLDAKTRAEVDALSLGAQQQPGWKDPNEVRATYNMPPKKLLSQTMAEDANKAAAAPSKNVLGKDDSTKITGDSTSTGSESEDPNSTGNGTNGSAHDVSNSNSHLSGTRRLKELPPRGKNGREALIEVLAMRSGDPIAMTRDRWTN